MPRYSLLEGDADDSVQGFRKEGSVTSADESSSALSYSDDEDDGREDEEWPHPLGFGTTRYALEYTETVDQYKRRWGYIVDDEKKKRDDDEEEGVVHVQRYPPLQDYYIDPKTVTTSALLRASCAAAGRRDRNDSSNRSGRATENDIDKLAHLLQAAAVLDYGDRRDFLLTSSVEPPLVLRQRDVDAQIKREMAEERRRLEQDHVQAAKTLQSLILRNEQKAAQIRSAEKARREEEQRRREEERIAAEEKEQAAALERQKAEEAKLRAAREEAAAQEYVVRAKKLVRQLEQVRASVEPFEKSKAVAKRRLQMKKTVNGRVNTLSESVDKIRSVAADVVAAYHAARAADDEIKEQIKTGAPNLTPEMARGKRYLIDLLSSNVIVRVQAEGFNGQRGDGFPLANMLALVSEDAKELVPVLAAHIYTVCPTAIPALPHPAPDATEEELMKSLGMLQGKDGNYETFERFLSRTEGVISLVADIMASEPSSHALMGGHQGAIKWLSRFLSTLPSSASPLPLLTAPVLDAFLTGVGHMLANNHEEEFRKCLTTITDDTLKRLDESPVGLPSATRLKKTVGVGLEGFKNTLPSRALPELYYGSNKSAASAPQHAAAPLPFSTQGTPQPPAQVQPSPFGAQQHSSTIGNTTQSTNASPFGTTQPMATTKDDRKPCTFFARGNCRYGDKCKFSHEIPQSSGNGGFGTTSAPSPFAASNTRAASSAPLPSPFTSSAPSPSPFGGGTSQSAFGQQTPPPPSASQSPFGSTMAPSPSPFISSAPSPSPFGGGMTQQQPGVSPSPFGAAPSPATFGSSTVAPSPSPFTSSAPTPSPFGGGKTQQQPSISSTPFGAAPSPATFGSSTVAPSPSPFTISAPSPSPFGGGTTQQQPGISSTPFGAAPSPSTFGSSTVAPSPSPFTSSAPAPSSFGGGIAATSIRQQPGVSSSPFGAAPSPAAFGSSMGTLSSPFTSSAPSTSPFGEGTSQPAFGQQQPGATSSPFGAGPSSLPFGQQGSPFSSGPGQGNAFGTQQRGSDKVPCKFFAEGRCKFGISCKFSHNTTSGILFGNNPFGGPR